MREPCLFLILMISNYKITNESLYIAQFLIQSSNALYSTYDHSKLIKNKFFQLCLKFFLNLCLFFGQYLNFPSWNADSIWYPMQSLILTITLVVMAYICSVYQWHCIGRLLIVTIQSRSAIVIFRRWSNLNGRPIRRTLLRNQSRMWARYGKAL